MALRPAPPRHRRRRFCPSLFGRPALLLGALLTAPAYAQVPPDLAAKVDEVFAWAGPSTPGCAVVVAKDNERLIDRAYGLSNLEQGVPITSSTVFDAGSVVKQFVAAAVLLLVEDGAVSLDDDIREYIPELPDSGHTVTVDHLLTHTGGVRDWVGLSQMSSKDEDALTLVLRQRGLNFVPGEEWSYSNSGFVLLKELVARVSGTSFSEFARRRLFEPLGMGSTTYAEVPQAGHAGLAVAYQEEGGQWEPGVLEGNERGGGGALLTTAGDLLTWTEALADARLGVSVTEKLQEPAQLNSGRALGYARGLYLDVVGGARTVWHDGSAGAYKAMTARFPEHDLSIAVLCNAGDGANPKGFTGRIAGLFLPDAPGDPADVPAAAEGVDVGGRAGLYVSEGAGEPLRLVEHDGRLRVEGGPALVPVGEGLFRNAVATLDFLSEDEVEFRFTSPDAFDLVGSDGAATRYRRAEPGAASVSEREALAGRYESEELQAVLEVSAVDDGLTVRLNGSRAFPLAAVARDRYQLGRMRVRFYRDRNGEVVGLTYSNPSLRNIPFERQGRADRPGGAPAPVPAASTSPTAESLASSPPLEGLVGEYQMAPGRTVTVTLEDDQLYGEPSGNPKRPLEHISGGTFAVGQTDSPITVTFAIGADGRATAMAMNQNGKERTLPRVR